MSKVEGVVIGIVSDIDDQDQLGRVRVKFPWLADEPSDWARIATPMGGKDRGLFFRPEVDDEVLVGFEHGDPRRPYVLGALWSKVDPPPADDGNSKKNNWRFFRSRSGHLLKFDDTDGSERIEITGKGGKHTLLIDVSGDKIELSASSGDIKVSAPTGTLTLEGNAVKVTSKSTLDIQANGACTVKGSTVAIN
jgi:uncharacterized protein involved in type VI secretion and phage assembly